MDYSKYIGLPYKDNGRDETGLDCWGLVCLFYKNELNIELPSYTELYSGGTDATIPEIILAHKSNWIEQGIGKVGDVCLFNIFGEPAHVGIFLGSGRFLHVRENQDSVIESLTSVKWSKRFVGFYKYSQADIVPVTGRPHPLKLATSQDLVVAGTTLQDFVESINSKYNISERLASKILVLVDDKVIPKADWSTTVIQKDQVVAYKTIPQRGQTGRLLLLLAVAVAVPYIAKTLAPGLAASAGAANATWGAKFAFSAFKMALTAAGQALVNAISPVREQKALSVADPGSAQAVSLFSGTSNSTNKFGAIPVVLGKARITGMNGAVPFVDTVPQSSLLHMIIVWGFGPLLVDDIRIGTNPIESYYDREFAQSIPGPVTLPGFPTDSYTQFDKIYGGDVEVSPLSPVELVNNVEDGNPWQSTVLENPCSEIAVSFTCPEGMRQLVISGAEAGAILPATANVEIQIRRYETDPATDGEPWENTSNYFVDNYASTTASNTVNFSVGYDKTFTGNIANNLWDGTEYIYYSAALFRKYTICLVPGGGIDTIAGAASMYQNLDPTGPLLEAYKSGNYGSLIGLDNAKYSWEPAVPSSFIKLYSFVINTTGRIEENTLVNHLTGKYNYYGLEIQTNVVTELQYDESGNASPYPWGTRVRIKTGSVVMNTAAPTQSGTVYPVVDSLSFVGGSVINVADDAAWAPLLKNKGIWTNDGSTEINLVKTSVEFKWDGMYTITGAADDEGAVYIDNVKILEITAPGYRSTISQPVFLKAGVYPVRVIAKNSGGYAAAIGFEITYTADGATNVQPSGSTLLSFGSSGLAYKRKDAFNYTHRFRNLPRGRYQVRARRVNSDNTEPASDRRNYHRVQIISVVGYDYYDSEGLPVRPIKDLPGTGLNKAHLAKTAIRIQSSNKANGTIDGVNAVVQTLCRVWDAQTQRWIPNRPSSNPAALFLYVLTHPANAYRIEAHEIATKIDLPALQDWYVFCETPDTSRGKPVLEYNGIVTGFQSVLDTLQDICAAGLASPNYVDGKWTVVVDKPRTSVVQYFTPHNSWNFESIKVLPQLPHAFRVSFQNRDKAYQTDEIIVYNYGYTSTTATIFEELNLPGVTNLAQAKYMARWHLAQLKLRPERYSLNTDFEYLICNRGDVVRVTHDVPRWGTGSGRIKAIAASALSLTEPVQLSPGIEYVIRIRLNTGLSKQYKVAPVESLDFYDYLELTNSINDNGSLASVNLSGVEVDNLFMCGELGKETQELVVLSIETLENFGAKISLTDYSPQIYTADLSDAGELPAYNSNITGRNTEILQKTITKAPKIIGVTSSSFISEEISTGIYQNTAVISYANSPGLTEHATRVQLEVQLGSVTYENNPPQLYTVGKEAGSFTVQNLKSRTMYKFRARYANAAGTIVGPWSDTYYSTIEGRTQNSYSVGTVLLDLEGTYIVATPTSDIAKPADFKTYEFRLYKDTGTEDFWELDTSTNNIIVTLSTTSGRFNLLDMPLPRISTEGITYRVACRPVDNNNNYSSESALGTIVVKTIQ